MVTRSMRWFGSWGLPHLSDESLLELHALLLAGEHSVAARYLRHVKQCEACTSRLDAVREDAAALRRDVTASADAQITTSRLERQFDVIMRRLEGHSGRVLPFPTTVHRPAPAPSLRRWVAMAAACGLLIGVGAGRMIAPACAVGADDLAHRQRKRSRPRTFRDAGNRRADARRDRRRPHPQPHQGVPRPRRTDAPHRRCPRAGPPLAIERSAVPVYWWVVQPLIFRKGLDLKDAVKGDLARDYHSDVVEQIRASDFTYRKGRLTIHLAREFGFCYGVDRAVDYAYQARMRFQDQRVFLTGEIIHNPHVNEKLRTRGHPVPQRPGSLPRRLSATATS